MPQEVVQVDAERAHERAIGCGADTWERLFLGQLQDQDDDLRRAVRDAVGHLDDAADKGRRRREPDHRALHLRDVTCRSGRTTHALPTRRGPIAAISGWTLGEPEKDRAARSR